jgi:hypothetical protein
MTEETRVCQIHGELPLSSFYKRVEDITRKSGKVHRYEGLKCKECVKDKAKRRLQKEPDYIAKKNLKKKAKLDADPALKEQHLIKARKYGCTHYWKNREKILDQHKIKGKDRREKTRLLVLQYYSGSDIPFCECCKESNLVFLVLDHKFGGGNEHRKKVKSKGNGFLLWVIRNDFPDMFRVLCHNCNYATIRGQCPHQSESGIPKEASTDTKLDDVKFGE